MEVCRICLAADRKMFGWDTKHKQLYENVTGITVQPIDRLPKHICWECNHFLSKYYIFKKKAVTSHFILMETLITQKTITSLKEYQPISTLTCTGIVYSNLDGVVCEESEEIEFKSEADQILIREEETNFTSFDNHDINFIRDNKLIDYIYDQENLTTKETVEIDTKIKENVENVSNEMPEEEMVSSETEIKSTEKVVKNLNNIEIPEDDGKNDIEIEFTENTVENLNSNEILDNLPSDYTDDDNDESESCASNGCDKISSKNIKNMSSEPTDESSKSKKQLESDKTLRTVTILSKDKEIAEMKTKEKHHNYVNVNPKFTEPMVSNGIQFAKTLRVELRKYNAPAEYAQLYGAPLKKPQTDSLKVKNNSNVSNEESVKTVNSNANVSQLFKISERLEEAKDVTDYTEIAVDDKNNRIIETCKDKFICEYCGHRFHKENSIILHIKKLCKKQFSGSGTSNNNVRIHTGEKPHPCTMCDKEFLQRCDLERHLRTHTGEKPYSCSVCNKQFRLSSTLNEHMRIHTGEKPYACTICEKQFISRSSVVKHMRTHTGRKPFSCKLCARQFSEIGSLNSHMRTHTGQKPYSCKVCAKQFSQSCNLNTHIRTHTGLKPYSCKVCTRQFNESSGLKKHMRIHTGEKPYSCTMCDKKFIRIEYMKRHMRTHTS